MVDVLFVLPAQLLLRLANLFQLHLKGRRKHVTHFHAYFSRFVRPKKMYLTDFLVH